MKPKTIVSKDGTVSTWWEGAAGVTDLRVVSKKQKPRKLSAKERKAALQDLLQIFRENKKLEEELTIKPCPKTVSGKHLFYPAESTHGVVHYCLCGAPDFLKCLACGLIDNR